ncbi:Fic family protein [Gordonia pseudamarae]|jgi:Fic family protein|uniref:Fic family protein n=1 Tax=Gordonia pseudamarae TaxID=2831662 RepID=A0ABX6IE34_9ACTN|nr:MULTISPECIES: Fic family protein [Gordonia]MBD0021531.1 Fic family protein [Gordonia sp. (in: high G+C Gram-positive bacteria)]QHN25175.1 Fic family protein [Gordonia pseudamarae]QHN34107.1 Fic family protein [Gordonia pseudamarae]
MAHLRDLHWQPADQSGLVASDRRGGRFSAYVPDPLCNRPLALDGELGAAAASAERAIRHLAAVPGSRGLSAISRLLTRSEAISSSMIEGIAPSPQQVALAELGLTESVRGLSDKARLVARNIAVLRAASGELVTSPEVTVADIEALHDGLLQGDHHRGIRVVQNWIGGSNWNPLRAEFVPPPPELVPALMADLVRYVNGASHGPLIQAGLVHAQFETIHPFTDGNGRVGRALIHTVLARGGLSPDAVLPISLVLATLSERYVAGLNSYRYAGGADRVEAGRGQATWLAFFIEATTIAIHQAAQLADDVSALETSWQRKVNQDRAARGLRIAPRADSAAQRILSILPEAPVLTGRSVERLIDVSFNAARGALDELADAGVLTRKVIDRRTTGYLAHDILDLVGITERRLASTQFDTRVAPPSRPVPASPPRRD